MFLFQNRHFMLLLGKHAYEWFNDRLGVSTLKDREVLMKGLVRLGYIKVIAEDVATPLKSRYAFLTVYLISDLLRTPYPCPFPFSAYSN